MLQKCFSSSIAAALCVLFVSSSGCGGGDSGALSPAPTPIPIIQSPSVIPTPAKVIAGPTVNISGDVTFDLVPHGSDGALNYEQIFDAPARGVVIELLNSAGAVLNSTSTDENGKYSLAAPQNTDVKIRVKAKVNDSAFTYEVVDNVNGGALYVMDSSVFGSGTEDNVRTLHAPSGWDTTEEKYSGARVAAPFAILDAIRDAVEFVTAVDANLRLPLLTLNWSSQNTAVAGSGPGELGSSHFSPTEVAIYILGDSALDTDEYDRSVLQHEFAHFLEFALWRSDNIGWDHSFDGVSDMRLAFGEGFANAFAGMVTGTGTYSDSFYDVGRAGFVLSLESDDFVFGIPGWFNETSVGRIIYDIYDSANDGADAISLGFVPIYDALSSKAYLDNLAFTSIYLLTNEISKNATTAQKKTIIDLMREQNIDGTTEWGTGETNSAGIDGILPIYKPVAFGGSVNVCSDNTPGEYNGVAVNTFLKFSNPRAKSVRIAVAYDTGLAYSDPDFILHHTSADFPKLYQSTNTSREERTAYLPAGDFVVEVYAHENRDMNKSTGGKVCYDVSVD